MKRQRFAARDALVIFSTLNIKLPLEYRGRTLNLGLHSIIIEHTIGITVTSGTTYALSLIQYTISTMARASARLSEVNHL